MSCACKIKGKYRSKYSRTVSKHWRPVVYRVQEYYTDKRRQFLQKTHQKCAATDYCARAWENLQPTTGGLN